MARELVSARCVRRSVARAALTPVPFVLVAIVLALGAEAATVVPVAVGASSAMCLSISTPPNAIAYGTGKITSSDLIQGGLWIGILAPLISVVWCSWVL